jgi:hypothetical protein
MTMPATTDVPVAEPRRRRPTPVTILAAVQTIIGVTNLGVAVVLLANAGQESPLIEALLDRSSFNFLDASLLPLALATIGLLDLAAAGLLLQVRRLGWTLAMLLAGFTLTVLIVTYAAGGTASTLALLLNVVAVLYLNASQTRAAFGLVPANQISLEDARG